jgi:hypothetical protein
VKSCDREEMMSCGGAHLRCSTRVVKVVMTDESWCDESVYECLGEVRRVM